MPRQLPPPNSRSVVDEAGALVGYQYQPRTRRAGGRGGASAAASRPRFAITERPAPPWWSQWYGANPRMCPLCGDPRHTQPITITSYVSERETTTIARGDVVRVVCYGDSLPPQWA